MVSALVLTMIVSQSMPSWVPDEFRDPAKYVWRHDRDIADWPVESIWYVDLTRLSDGAWINLGVRLTENPDKPFFQRQTMAVLRDGPLDGFPLGVNCEILEHASHFDLKVKDSREGISFSINGPVIGKGRSRYIKQLDFSGEEAWFISQCRTALSRFASRRAGPRGKMTVGATAVETFVAHETGVTYVDMEGYLQAKGSALTRNAASRRFSFSVNAKSCLVLLGTSQAKIDGSWKRMEDVPMEIDGKVWIPLRAIQ